MKTMVQIGLLGGAFLGLSVMAHGLEGWKAEANFGYSWGDAGSTPTVTLGAFQEVLPMPRPEFYDAGVRLVWEPGLGLSSFRTGVGVRHKMYFATSSLWDQEVMADVRWQEKNPLVGLSGRFGGRWPSQGGVDPYSGPSWEAHLVWFLGWSPWGGRSEQRLGLELGTSFGGP